MKPVLPEKKRKASLEAFPPRLVEEMIRRLPAKGWAEMIRRVYEVAPMLCPNCGETMKVVPFLTDYAVDERSARFPVLLTTEAAFPTSPARPSRS